MGVERDREWLLGDRVERESGGWERIKVGVWGRERR